MHSTNSILYLEDQINSATIQNEDILLDSIIPYMVYSVPTLEFTDSQSSISPPEFYETYPIYVSAEKYEQVKSDYNTIYKISSLETSELQIIPRSSVHYLYSDVVSIDVYLVWSITNPLYSADYSYLGTLETEDFEFDPLSGLLSINNNKTMELKEKLKNKQENYPEKEMALCFEVNIEKYRSIEDVRKLSREEVDQIITMQTAHASVLEYYYQFNLASKQEEQLQELAYITTVTAISTAISIGVSFGIGKIVGMANKYLGSLVNLPDLAGITGIQSVSKVQQILHGVSAYLMQASVSLSGFSIAIACVKEISQEIFIDPLVETLVSNLVRELGCDATMQMIASTLAESLREEFSGQISGMFKGSQSGLTFQNYMDKRLTAENQYPIGQELIQYFNQYKAELADSQYKKYGLKLLGVIGTSLKLFTTAVSAYSISKLADSKREFLIKSLGIGIGALISAPIFNFLALSYGIVGVAIGAGFITSMTVSLTTTFGDGEDNFTPLASKQITRREEKYKRMLQELCVQYALDFKNILIKEYGYNILELGKQLPLTTHFGFRLDGYIRKVTNAKRDRAVGGNILERVKNHIIEEFNTWDKDWVKQSSFKRVMDFIKEYQEFSLLVSGKSGQGMFSISNIKYDQNSKKLLPKSWLIENLRYLFPKKFGLPLSDNLLSWFVYGDTPSYGRVAKIKWTMDNKEINKRMYITDLLAIDYRVSKLTTKYFSAKGIKISDSNLEKLQKSVSYLVYYYVFGGYHDSTYVSKTTNKKLEVGKDFFTIEYEVIRAIFFAAAEANNGEPLNFEELQLASGASDLKNHLAEGFGFGDDFDRLQNYFNGLFKNKPLDSSYLIFRNAKEVLDRYHDEYKSKYSAFLKTRKDASKFQGRVHKELEAFLGLHFTKEVQVRAVVKEKYVSTINKDDVKEKIYVHNNFKFDGYLDLSKALKDYLGLDDKWMGIAFEALGTYWHSDANPSQQEADRKKRLICREKNIILLEIPEAMDSSEWGAEALRQFKATTGVEIPQNKLRGLSKYLGIT